MTWYAQENDLVGGYMVTNVDLPASKHDFRPCGDPKSKGYVFADMMRHADAIELADLLNREGIEREDPTTELGD